MPKVIIASVLAAFMLLMQGVFANGADPVTYDQKSTTIMLSEAQPVFIIKLISNPTTGYSWSLHDYDKSLLTSVKHDFHAPNNGLIGAPGYELWTFRAKPAAFATPQRTTLSFAYARPWEKGAVVDSVEFVVKTRLR